MTICAKTISYWARKGVSIAKAHLVLGTLQTPAVSVSLAAGVSVVSILQAGDWARISIPTRHYFSTYFGTMHWHKDSV